MRKILAILFMLSLAKVNLSHAQETSLEYSLLAFIGLEPAQQSGIDPGGIARSFDIYTYDMQSQSIQNITQNPGYYSNIVSLGDGRMGYEDFLQGNSEIYVFDPLTDLSTNITNNPTNDSGAVWSSDGRIAFNSFRDDLPDVYIMDTTTGSVSRVTNDAHFESGLAWSNDGRLAYESGKTGINTLYIYDTHTGETSNLIEADAQRASWSPDGKLAFHSQMDIFVYDGTTIRNSSPAWSADSGYLAFVSDRAGQSDIWLLNLQEFELINLTESFEFDVARPIWLE